VIVRRVNGRLLLIRQVDHGALSGEFARHWGNQHVERPAPLESVALASAMHDHGWLDKDEEPLFDAQRQAPLHWRDIRVPDHIAFYGEGARRAAALDPYAGLLVSMHCAGIYTRRYGTYPVKMSKLTDAVREITEAFVAEQEAFQADLKRRVWNPSQRRSEFERRLWTQYDQLQIWDRLSLFVCLNDLKPPSADRLGPLPVAVDGPVVDLTVEVVDNGVVALDPYPFDVPALEASVPARAVPDRRYASAGDLWAALQDAADSPIRCRFVPATHSAVGVH
jgi:hypothetical protein